ncbi:MAG: glycosyltransferase N-terminal domain-containing protein [Bacteroidales bacterium]|jgi:3-deoxy-D-manno-octulosonic-acid transferase|nr:glycosyltransferase N-terminal domain-containing protein [Bacteroidales bacterium]
MIHLYNIGILIYTLAVRLASPFSEKARLWIRGRKGWEQVLKAGVDPSGVNLWFHCASLGEFEQGRPVMEELKKKRPECKIILTFFSPSGYEIRKKYAGADFICYLPADTPRNARKFISAINPSAVFFVKYEFWKNFILETRRQDVPLYLISGIFRPGQHFFKWYGGFFRKMLFSFTHIFVQDADSERLLKETGLQNVTVAGDTRFDRVVQIAGAVREIPQIRLFRGHEKLFLTGSSWPPDEEIIVKYLKSHPGTMKWVFAPHEIGSGNIERLLKLTGEGTVRFSAFTEKDKDARVMIIDNIGMLSSAYRYADIAAVGGGFGKGIHNVLEAACWGIPVLFGPNHIKFREALMLKAEGAAKSFSSYADFETAVDGWLSDDGSCEKAALKAGEYVRSNAGATERILEKAGIKDMNNHFS